MNKLNVMLETDKTEFHAGKTVYTFLISQGGKEGRRFKMSIGEDGKARLDDDKVPPIIASLMYSELMEYRAALHREGIW
jgi:sulfatase maturation enzyme AslB (radical SAM superfamily)